VKGQGGNQNPPWPEIKEVENGPRGKSQKPLGPHLKKKKFNKQEVVEMTPRGPSLCQNRAGPRGGKEEVFPKMIRNKIGLGVIVSEDLLEFNIPGY